MKPRQALVCSPDIPAHDRESGSRRVYHLIEFLREAGWSVTVVAQEAQNAERYVAQMQQRGVAAYVGFNARLEQLLDCQRFDLALFAFWHVAESLLPLVRRHSPATRILIDSIDLHFLRNARGVFSRPDKPGVPPTLDQKFATEMMRELNLYAAADGVLTVSEKEADLINDLTSDPMLAFAVPDAEEMPLSPHPFAERKGILFIGNFRHAPNVGAAEYLCTQIVPLLDPALLAAHPIAIVGNELNEQVRSFARGLTGVNLVGWVPSVLPYLQRARITVIPLRYGAGTKRKLIQALMVGTPSVSTSIGAEGLGLTDGQQVLVADDPARFASAMTRLIQDPEVWQRLAENGRSHVTILHGRSTAATRLLEVVSEVLVREPKLPPVAAANSSEAYEHLIGEVCNWVHSAVPEGASVLVVSRGDDRLLELSGRSSGHFPQSKTGAYAGHHPGNSDEAIAHLESLRAQGAQFLVFPRTASWWLEHYREFAAHLDAHYVRSSLDDVCILYHLSPRGAAVGVNGTTNARPIERPAPTPLHTPDLSAFLGSRHTPAHNVLVLGVYLTDQPNTADDIAANMATSIVHRVTQRWVALGAVRRMGTWPA